MPELAEVETLRRDVEAEFGGQVVVGVEATGRRSLRRHPDPADFEARVRGRTLEATARRGKFLLMHLDGGDVLVAHMGMSGQLLRTGPGAPRLRHTHVVLAFGGGAELHFVDPRTFGQMFVTTADLAELAGLGLDPLTAPAAEIEAVVSSRPTKLKPLLMDQRFIAGIGNMYADEILFEAGIRPDRPGRDLSAVELRRLHAAMVEVLEEAVEHRGSSLADEQYRDLYGRLGRYQERHRVYGREGGPCPRCGRPVVRMRAYGRSSFFCEHCQR